MNRIYQHGYWECLSATDDQEASEDEEEVSEEMDGRLLEAAVLHDTSLCYTMASRVAMDLDWCGTLERLARIDSLAAEGGDYSTYIDAQQVAVLYPDQSSVYYSIIDSVRFGSISCADVHWRLDRLCLLETSRPVIWDRASIVLNTALAQGHMAAIDRHVAANMTVMRPQHACQLACHGHYQQLPGLLQRPGMQEVNTDTKLRAGMPTCDGSSPATRDDFPPLADTPGLWDN